MTQEEIVAAAEQLASDAETMLAQMKQAHERPSFPRINLRWEPRYQPPEYLIWLRIYVDQIEALRRQSGEEVAVIVAEQRIRAAYGEMLLLPLLPRMHLRGGTPSGSSLGGPLTITGGSGGSSR